MKRKLLLGSPVFLLVASVTFLVVRQFASQPVSEAQQGEGREPFWFAADIEADDRLSRLDHTIQGIRIGPNVDDRDAVIACGAGYEQAAEGFEVPAEMSPVPGYLPPGTEFTDAATVLCEGETVSAEANYWVPPGDGRLGGILLIYRYQGERSFRLDVPADRTRGASIAGRAAVVVDPITPDGLGLTAVVLNEPWGLTVVRATGLPHAELLRIAESIGTQAPQ